MRSGVLRRANRHVNSPEEICMATPPSLTTSLLRFLRFEYLSFAMLLPLIGAATVSTGQPIPLLRTLGILAATLALHVHINLMNDVCDLPFDRNHPGRQKYPLVRGVIKPWQVSAIALSAVPVAFAVTHHLGGSPLAHVALGLVIAAIAVYNVWGKRFVFPPMTDVALGVGYASITLYGAAMIGAPVRLTWIAFSWVVVWTLQINLLGGMRDLNFDLAAGARTTPIVFGVRPKGIALHIPRSIAFYGLAIEVALFGLAMVALWHNDFGYSTSARVLLAAALALLEICTVLVLKGLFRLGERDFKAMGKVGFVPIGLTLLSIVVLLAPNPNRWPMVLIMLTYFIPLRKVVRSPLERHSKIAMRS
jgi:4-hydroxybenzoate polyprenyltransferase